MSGRILPPFRFSNMAAITLAVLFCSSNPLTAQSDDRAPGERITDHLASGEFSLAIDIAERLPAEQADRQFIKIASAQFRSGAGQSAIRSLRRVADDRLRFEALYRQRNDGAFVDIGNPPQGGDLPNGNLDAAAGGVTQADFQPLINLIRNTIDPDGWNDTNGDGIILAYPAGVYVDPDGTLQRLKFDPRRNLQKLARNASVDSGNRMVDRTAALRKVSLNRLERELQFRGSQGLPITRAMEHLAGVYEVRFLMVLPETGDVVIAGPAGPWTWDEDGHAINMETGKPVLRLDDLVVLLRNAQAPPLGNGGRFGCSITPRKQNLIATRQFLETSTLKGARWRRELRKTLGQQDVEVFGLDPATHAGRVLVEADYRMKLVAMGLEESIPQIPSYLDRLDVASNGQAQPMDVVRWWFTMNYDEVLTDEHRQIFRLTGSGVKVLSENEFINDQGDRIHTGQSAPPTQGFARDFTTHFDKIADKYPVYRRLKNLFDLAIVATLIREYDLDHKASWHLTHFGNHPDHADFVFQPATASVATQVDSVINHRTITRRQRGQTLKHTLVGVSGGIRFDAKQVLRSRTRIAEDSIEPGRITGEPEDPGASDRWWWD